MAGSDGASMPHIYSVRLESRGDYITSINDDIRWKSNIEASLPDWIIDIDWFSLLFCIFIMDPYFLGILIKVSWPVVFNQY